MIPRQKQLFKNIVEEYISAAVPVGSKLVVKKYHPDVSSATVRNDMMELEEQGLITQPYTSAGRIPTEYGYRYYVDNYVDKKAELIKKEKDKMDEFIKNIKIIKNDYEKIIKQIAKVLAEESGLAVFIGFDKNDVYYTGLSNLFSQPEFQDVNLICNMSLVIDHLDVTMADIYDKITELEISIGRTNPFDQDCAVVMYKIKNILVGILGPMRMDYAKNVALINFIKSII